MKYFLPVAIGMGMNLLTGASSAMAEITEKDVLVLGRIAALVQGMPKGTIKVSVVADDAGSSADADVFINLVGEGKVVGDVTLVASRVKPGNIATSGASVILIPASVDDANLDVIFDLASQHKLTTISTSDNCLNRQKCALSIKTSPAVDIRLSQSAAKATGVSFGSNLRMMIKEMP
jgi:hypothetical protein